MPNNATQLYYKNPDLQIVLDFLERCVPDALQMTAHYHDARQLEAVKAACARSNIGPVDIFPVQGLEEETAQPGLTLDRADWLALAQNAMSLLAQELRMRLPAITAAMKLVPVPWDALALPDRALAAWGAAADMVALPGRTVFNYFGSRYPGNAVQRGRYAVVRDVEHAAAYRENHALGFLFIRQGAQAFACQRDDWRSEVASATGLLDDHLSLMLKIGLQMLEAGGTGQLKNMQLVLELAGETPSLVRLQALLETYEDHVASYGAGQNRFRNTLLKKCLGAFQQWQTNCGLVVGTVPGAAHDANPIVMTREWKWINSGAAAGAPAIPAPGPLASQAIANPVIAEGVIIPNGVTVAKGAHVRVCSIGASTRLRPGTVLHGDVSIASHTRFDGPLTIMHDVRIGWGLTFGAGLILTEGATITSFTVKCGLPRGTRISGSLRIGKGSKVANNVSFGPENWIGEHVHIGKNVRFGPYVKVDDGVSIGDNAWIKGHALLIGDVPENAELADQVTGPGTHEKEPDGLAYAINISAFNITKNETIYHHPATLRLPLACGLDADNAYQDLMPHPLQEGAESPDRRPGHMSLNPPPPPLQASVVRSPAALGETRHASSTRSAIGKSENRLEALADAPAGVQHKRGGDALPGRPAKRFCTGLESHYQAVESGNAPLAAADQPDNSKQGMRTDSSHLLNKSAFRSVQPTATSTSTTTTATWLDLQMPVLRPSSVASIATSPVLQPVRHRADSASTGRRQTAADPVAGTRQAAPAKPPASEMFPDMDAQRTAWQKSMISKENQNALERGMRQTISVPAAGPRAKGGAAVHQPNAKTLAPMYASMGPNL